MIKYGLRALIVGLLGLSLSAQQESVDNLVKEIREVWDGTEISVFKDLSSMAKRFDVVVPKVQNFLENSWGAPLKKAFDDTDACIATFFGVMASIRNGIIKPQFGVDQWKSKIFTASDGKGMRYNSRERFRKIDIKQLEEQVKLLQKSVATMNSSWSKVKPGFFQKNTKPWQKVLGELVDRVNFLANNFLKGDYNYKELRGLILNKS